MELNKKDSPLKLFSLDVYLLRHKLIFLVFDHMILHSFIHLHENKYMGRYVERRCIFHTFLCSWTYLWLTKNQNESKECTTLIYLKKMFKNSPFHGLWLFQTAKFSLPSLRENIKSRKRANDVFTNWRLLSAYLAVTSWKQKILLLGIFLFTSSS